MAVGEKKKPGTVYLVGAGPGDPGLLTVKGRDCLAQADALVYDYLGNPVLLDHAPAAAARIYVGKTKGCPHTPQERINALLVDLARTGKTVVRLKGGDPYVFGRGGEEAQALHGAGIPFEVVPGVTAGFAAAAYAGIPLTHRDYTTSLGLVTGHEKPERKLSSLDWEKLATGVGTLVFYMGMANLEVIAGQLVAHGRSPQTPVAIIRWATTPRQQTLVADLATIVAKARETAIKPPAVIIVGEVVGLRSQLGWFEQRPLLGRRILVTRAAEQAGSFTALLEAQGAECLACPTIAIAPPEDLAPLDAALGQLARIDDLILTSANAVQAFFGRLLDLGRDARALGGVRVVAVGPKTAEVMAVYGIRPDLVPAEYHADAVVALLEAQGVAGRRVLYPRADRARELIPQRLAAAGAEVLAPVAYRNVRPEGGAERLRALLAEGVDAITFTSSSTVSNLLALAGEELRPRLATMPLISIGPLTSRTLAEAGLAVAAEAQSSTLEGMVAALVEFFTQAKGTEA